MATSSSTTATSSRFLTLLFLLSHLVAVTRTKSQDNFYFDPAPIAQDVIGGEEVWLRCDVSNRRHISFSWELDNRPLANTSRRYQVDSDLRILRVDSEQDGGGFRCIATNATTGVSLRSIEAKLNIQWLSETAEVELKKPREIGEIVEGTDLSLRCQAEGNPEPDVDWFRNGIRLFPDDRIKFHKNARVKIVGVTSGDNGVYSCKAKNIAGDVKSADNFYLNLEDVGAPVLNLDTFTRVLLVKAGGRAQFDCEYDNVQLTEWYFDGKVIKNTSSPRETIVHPNGTLVMSEVRRKDEGIYTCTGIGEDSAPDQSYTSELLLAYIDDLTPDSFEPKQQAGMPHVVSQDQRFDVRCLPAKGLPTPSQRWEGPFGDIPDAGRIKADAVGLLSITNAHPDDSGNYTCVLENLAGAMRHNVWIVVSVPPTISTPPLSERVTEGDTGSFTCKVQGTPFPVTRVSWLKEDKAVDLTHPRFTVDPESGTLTIIKTRLADKGNYACLVNTTGQKTVMSQNAHLYVEKMLKFKPEPVNTKLELHSDSRIYCKAEGRVLPAVRWVKIGERGFRAEVVDLQGTLNFAGVTKEDEGRYMCIAESAEQGRINATIDVEVVVKPKFQVHPANTTAYEGYAVMLHCMAVGEPKPLIRWDKNHLNQPLDENRFTILNNGTLLISEVYMEDIGYYGCTAGNAGGLTREEIFLTVRTGNPIAEPTDKFNMMKTIVIAVCSAVAYLAIVIGLTVYCSIRLVRAKNLRKQMLSENGPVDNNHHNDKHENGTVVSERTELMDKKERDSSIVKSDMDARSHISGVSSHQSHSSQSGRSSTRAYDKLAFPRHDLQTLGMLGKGQFGDVFLAKAHGIRNGEPESLVVVKSLLSRDEPHHFEFRRELDMFNKLNHEHIVKLLGVCREMEPQFLITEYCDWGDLKQFLWATRKDNNTKRNLKLPPLTLAQKVTMCSQVALGMEHLANHRFVHRDLAARNVLLTSTLNLKVSMLSLCRDVYAQEYFPFHANLMPLRWLSPEAVLEDEFSNKSDVWAFGVFCWEVMTLGDLPHAGRPDEEVLKGLKAGDISLDPVPGCPPEMWTTITRCRAENPIHRPSFSEIALAIGEMQVDSDV